MNPNLEASLKARLLNVARAQQAEFELVLVRYANERFLYRLGASPYRDRFIVKGAALLTLWIEAPYRATRDLDLLAAGAGDAASLRQRIESILGVDCPEDGLVFDLSTLELAPIQAEQEYVGQRATLVARLGKARARVQIDCGLGDSVDPPAEEAVYPTLLPSLPAPRVRAYPREVSIAEKFEAMVGFGFENSRMKDFHDVWALASRFAFEGPTLRRALGACFARRGREWAPELPYALRDEFYRSEALVVRWSGYRRKQGVTAQLPPARFEEIGEVVQRFLGPVRESLAQRLPFDQHWPAGGPWS